MTRCYLHLIMVSLFGVMAGCAPFDQYGSSNANGPYYPSDPNSNGPYYPNSGTAAYPHSAYNNGYPYGATYASSRYPVNGYETEYRKAQQSMNTPNKQAIVDGISQQMLSGGWYPEGLSGNQLVFTKVRDRDNQKIYYKTVYTLVPSGNGYMVYANMKLKTTDSSYNGSLDDAAHRMSDGTENLLAAVKQQVEKPIASITTTPVPMVQKIFTNPETQLPIQQPLKASYSSPVDTPAESMNQHELEKHVEIRPSPVRVERTGINQYEQTVSSSPVPIEKTHVEQRVQKEQQQNNQETIDQPKEKIEKMKQDKRQSKDDDKKKVQTSESADTEQTAPQ